jgi:predicted ABC-type exoprotein transport system permease subunit
VNQKTIYSLVESIVWGAIIGLFSLPIAFVAILFLIYSFFFATIAVMIVSAALILYFSWLGIHDPAGAVLIVALYLVDAILCLALSGIPVIPTETKPHCVKDLSSIIQSSKASAMVYVNMAVMFAMSVAVSHTLFHWIQKI